MGKASGPIPVAIMGLGFTGRSIAEAALASPELMLCAAIDTAPSFSGKTVAEIVPGAPANLRIESNPSRAFRDLKGGVLLHATGSRLEKAHSEIEAAVRAGIHVISVCEELAFPWLNHDALANELDELATKHKVSVLGTGSNPGFVMDRLVATAGAICGPVRKVRVERTVEAAASSESLRRKAGLGLTPEELEKKIADNEVGHIGLSESAALCAIGLGLDFEDFDEEIEGLEAEEDFVGAIPIEKGRIAGIVQRVRGFYEEREVVALELTLAAGIKDPHSLINIDANPSLELRISGGYSEELATSWSVINSVARVVAAEPGVLTVLELPAGR